MASLLSPPQCVKGSVLHQMPSHPPCCDNNQETFWGFQIKAVVIIHQILFDTVHDSYDIIKFNLSVKELFNIRTMPLSYI